MPHRNISTERRLALQAIFIAAHGEGAPKIARRFTVRILPFVNTSGYALEKYNDRRRNRQVKSSAWLGLLIIAASAHGAFAQQPADNLTDQQKRGRQVFAQSCGVCHLPPSLGAKTYGPALYKDAGGGDNDVMREFVENGTPRMPAFKHYLKPEEIDAIISYVRTVPVQAAPPANAPRAMGGGEP
jgi:mono/diheme cytochrome c family protein